MKSVSRGGLPRAGTASSPRARASGRIMVGWRGSVPARRLGTSALSAAPAPPTVARRGGGMFQAQVRVIYGDTDQMGVVYYAIYLRYFELAGIEFLRAHVGTYREMHAEEFNLPVVEASVRYQAPARYEDLLAIVTEVREVTRVTLTFAYVVTRVGEQAVLCTGTTVHACLGSNGRPTRLPGWVAR